MNNLSLIKRIEQGKKVKGLVMLHKLGSEGCYARVTLVGLRWEGNQVQVEIGPNSGIGTAIVEPDRLIEDDARIVKRIAMSKVAGGLLRKHFGYGCNDTVKKQNFQSLFHTRLKPSDQKIVEQALVNYGVMNGVMAKGRKWIELKDHEQLLIGLLAGFTKPELDELEDKFSQNNY